MTWWQWLLVVLGGWCAAAVIAVVLLGGWRNITDLLLGWSRGRGEGQ
ncbi:hypothetical protein KGA66_06155 [Actinocrinis puniceicyclus]|uniref:Uncharacterized protein n=1 Tax=Actinocrinis puniceicyclus TaxID=977794 RepID=A0A8J7WM21_9ACTN|nr:hypothetical protein [Actinocrinis puniceicyclus]MBS2962622.1 hypothetical protein [Actinocrinis puniceicyclus]